MTSRERVLAALNHTEPDRVPRLLYEEAIGYTPPIQKMLREHCGTRLPRDYFRMDISSVTSEPTTLPRERFAEWLEPQAAEALASGQVDEWGVWWRAGGFHHFAHVESPLRGVTDFEAIQRYPWPDVDEPARFKGLKEKVAYLHEQGFAVAAYAGSVFEQSWYIRGFEALMMDMVTSPEIAHYMFERTAAFQKTVAVEFARAGVDIIITGDDIAGQKGMLMKLEAWREFLKPRLAETIRAVKAAEPAVRVFYHSDGNVQPAIPDLIEAGIDILNPVQPECMDPGTIKARYGDRLSFWGSVSVQNTMPRGTPDQVRDEVRRRIAEMGRGGGFILAPAHVLGPETPWENVVAFFEAADGVAVRR